MKETIISNIKNAREIILTSFKDIIKTSLIKADKEYKALQTKLLEPISNIEEYIEKNEYFHSFKLVEQINDIQIGITVSEKIARLLEKNFWNLDIKNMSKLFSSSGWIQGIKINRNKFEFELKVKRPVFELELQTEAANLVSEIEKLKLEISEMNTMTDFEKSYENQEVIY